MAESGNSAQERGCALAFAECALAPQANLLEIRDKLERAKGFEPSTPTLATAGFPDASYSNCGLSGKQGPGFPEKSPPTIGQYLSAISR
jgi:hypothetical protein